MPQACGVVKYILTRIGRAVEVEAAPGEAGRMGDPIDRGRVEAARRKQAERYPEDLVAAGLEMGLASVGNDSWHG